MSSHFISIFIFSLAIIVVEGLGLVASRQFTLGIILLTPFFLYILDIIILKKKYFLISFSQVILLTIFLTLTGVSLFFAFNKQIAFEYFLWYIAAGLVFIYTYGQEKYLKPLLYAGIGASTLFLLLAINSHFQLINLLRLYPSSGYNLYYSTFEDHNHLGDLLVPLYGCILYLGLKKHTHKSLFYVLSLFLFILIYISHSRTALLSSIFLTGVLYISLNKNKLSKAISWLTNSKVIISSVFVLFAGIFLCAHYSAFIPKQLISIINGRDNLWNQSLQSLLHYSLGIGPENFFVSSLKYSFDPSDWSYTSTNIFFDIFVENGVIAGIIFLVFIDRVLKGIEKKSVVFFITIATLLMFQFDYVYRFYSLGILFFVLLGSSQKKEITHDLIKLPLWVPLLISIFLFLAQQTMLVSNILTTKKQYESALRIYPLNEQAHNGLIEKYIKESSREKTLHRLSIYLRLFGNSPHHLKKAAHYYLVIKDRKQALESYEKAYAHRPVGDTEIYKAVYSLRYQLYGKTFAQPLLEDYFIRVKNISNKNSLKRFLYNDIKDFCLSHRCPSYDHIF